MSIAEIKTQSTFMHVLNFHSFRQGKQMSDGRVYYQCPSHEDRKPSLLVYADGHAHCYTCKAHYHSVIDLLAQIHHVEPARAIIPVLHSLPELAAHADDLQSEAPPPRDPYMTKPKPKPGPGSQLLDDLSLFWEQVERFADPELSAQYWQGRGLSRSVSELCQMRFIGPSELPKFTLAIRAMLKGDRYAPFCTTKGSPRWAMPWRRDQALYPIFIPLWSPAGLLTGMQMRAWDPPEGAPRYMTISSYGLARPPGRNPRLISELLLCEGAPDAMTAIDAGHEAWGIPGLHQPAVLEAYARRVKIDHLIIAFDPPRKQGAPELEAAHAAIKILNPNYATWLQVPAGDLNEWWAAYVGLTETIEKPVLFPGNYLTLKERST